MSQNIVLIQDPTAATAVCTDPPRATQKVTTSPGEAASGAPEPPILSIKVLGADKNQPSPEAASHDKDL